ncbi:tetratricopeptide repeat protein [[Phormidium] sp. ETS-05]|uniref:tetratricopeptide repeat protein n=1 Tax=[Phormidium] sp. ETS-05 TaxID=222819 RepID=UPI0018EF0B95|nr:tetratricopeptide repeat protein [[Phormidium] sp. ETS-05]
MDEQRFQQYLQLIEALLACPSGEEPQILAAHTELLDGEFVQVVAAVAEQAAAAGQDGTARFLQQLAAELGQKLGQNHPSPQGYLEFLQAALRAELEVAQGNTQAIYAVLGQNLDKLDTNFGRILVQWAEATVANMDDADLRELIASLIENLCIHIYQFPLGSKADRIEIAIAGYQFGLSQRQNDPPKRAQTQNNLANAYRNRIRGERAENLKQAIQCYEAALQVRTRAAYPEDWAMTQNNLANAYRNRIRGERAENLKQAIQCYEAALQVRTRAAYPEQWATTQNNLAAAYSNRIRGERAENLKQAIQCYEAALQVYTRAAYPQNHAETLFNLGLAYRDLGALEAAAATFAAAIETVEHMRSGIIMGGEADRQRLAAEWDQLYRNMVEVCLEMTDFARAMVYAERTKARNLVELIAATRLKPEPVPDDVWLQYQDLLQQWRNLLEMQSPNPLGKGGRESIPQPPWQGGQGVNPPKPPWQGGLSWNYSNKLMISSPGKSPLWMVNSDLGRG